MTGVHESFTPEFKFLNPDDTEAALRVPMGIASPLWFAFGATAVGASAWWWMTRWTQAAAAFRPPEPASFASTEDAPEPPEALAFAADLVIDPVVEAPVAVAPEPEFIAPVVAAEEAANDVAPEVEAPEIVADDLTRLVGIGPKLAAALAERGVTRFAQIAAWQAKELDEVDKALSLKGRATREAWVSQARRLAEG